MKKFNLFAIGVVAMLMAATGVYAAEPGACVADTAAHFVDCTNNNNKRLIEVTSSYSISDATLNNKRVVIDNGVTLTVTGTLKVENFAIDNTDSDSFAAVYKNSNILLQTGAKLLVKGTLTASRTRGTSDDTVLITGQTFTGDVEVEGKLDVTGYAQGVRCDNLVVTGEYEATGVDNATNTNKVTVDGEGVINSHDNVNGLTTKNLEVKGNAKVNATGNKQHGVFADQATLSDNAVVESKGNHTDTENYPNGSDVRIGQDGDFNVSGKATLKAGTVTSKNSHKLTVSGNTATLDVEDIESGAFTAPAKMNGIVKTGNKVYVYTLEGDTVEVSIENANSNGGLHVYNNSDKDIYVVTADSSVKEANKLAKGKDKVYYLVKITAKVGTEISEGELVLFKGQQFSEISESGMAKLNEMLAVEGQHINNYVVDTTNTALIATSTISANTVVKATYYIVITIGNQEFWVNPGTKLSELNNADKAKLQAIKTASDKKFMYFATADGKAISETDTVFNKDTTLLVLYEGDAAPVVPDTPGDSDKPDKPDDGTTPGDSGETTTQPGATNPDTLDNVTSVAAMGGISLAIAAAGIATLKKREN